MSDSTLDIESSDDEIEVIEAAKGLSSKRGRPLDDVWNECKEIKKSIRTIDLHGQEGDKIKRYAQCKHCGH
jgi:hypothetical protein